MARINSNRAFEKIIRFEKQWKQNIQGIHNLWNVYLSNFNRNKIPLSDDPFLSEFNNVLIKYSKEDNPLNFNVINEQLLEPLKTTCKTHIGQERSIELLPLIIDANDAYLNITTARKLFSDRILEHSQHLEEHKDLISTAIVYFKTD